MPRSCLSLQPIRVEAWAGILVEKAATFQGVEVAIQQVSHFGVHLRGDGTKADTTSCRLSGRKGRHPCAFHITDKACLDAQNVDISSFASSVDFTQGAGMELGDVQMLICVDEGVCVHDASVKLTRVHIEGAHRKAVTVTRVSGSVHTHDCTIIQASVAVCVSMDATAELHNCTLQDGLRGSLLVDDALSRAALAECVLQGKGKAGARAHHVAKVSLTRCTWTLHQESLSSRDSTCYDVFTGSSLSGQRGDCEFELFCPSAAEDCAIRAAKDSNAKGVRPVGDRIGALFLDTSTGTLRNCRFEGCTWGGLEALERAAVELKTCQVRMCRGSTGEIVCHERKRTLTAVRRRIQMHLNHARTVADEFARPAGCAMNEVGMVMDGDPNTEVRCAGCKSEWSDTYRVFVIFCLRAPGSNCAVQMRFQRHVSIAHSVFSGSPAAEGHEPQLLLTCASSIASAHVRWRMRSTAPGVAGIVDCLKTLRHRWTT